MTNQPTAEIIARLDKDIRAKEARLREAQAHENHAIARLLTRSLTRARTLRLEYADALYERVGFDDAARQIKVWWQRLGI